MLVKLLKLFGTGIVETKFEPEVQISDKDYEAPNDPEIKECKYCGYDIDTNREELCGRDCYQGCWRYLGLIE